MQNDEVKSKIKIDLAADNCPDVFYYWNAASDLSSMIEADVLLPMSEYLAHPDAALSWDQFMESSIFTVMGERYGFAMENWEGAWLANKTCLNSTIWNIRRPMMTSLNLRRRLMQTELLQ